MKIRVKYLEEEKNKSEIDNTNHIVLYLLGIKIKKIKISRKIHADNNNNKYTNTVYMITKQILRATSNKEILKVINNIIKTIKVEKLDLNLGINLYDPIANAYTIALVNVILPTFLAKQQIALNNLRYTTFISNKIIHIDADVLIQVSILRNIANIIKIIWISKKESKKLRN